VHHILLHNFLETRKFTGIGVTMTLIHDLSPEVWAKHQMPEARSKTRNTPPLPRVLYLETGVPRFWDTLCLGVDVGESESTNQIAIMFCHKFTLELTSGCGT
jgi:hypothetical protein